MSVLMQPEQPNQIKPTQPNQAIGEAAHANQSCNDVLLQKVCTVCLSGIPSLPRAGWSSENLRKVAMQYKKSLGLIRKMQN